MKISLNTPKQQVQEKATKFDIMEFLQAASSGKQTQQSSSGDEMMKLVPSNIQQELTSLSSAIGLTLNSFSPQESSQKSKNPFLRELQQVEG